MLDGLVCGPVKRARLTLATDTMSLTDDLASCYVLHSSILWISVPTKQDSGDSDGNRILQDQKQKLLQDCGAPAPAFYWELPWKKELLFKKVLLLNPDLLFQ